MTKCTQAGEQYKFYMPMDSDIKEVGYCTSCENAVSVNIDDHIYHLTKEDILKIKNDNISSKRQ